MSTVLGRPTVIKKANKSVVKEEIRNNPMITKPELAALIGLSLATINKIVDELEAKREIISCGYQKSTGGRKAKTYRINGARSCKIIVYIQPVGYVSALLNNDNTVLERHEDDAPFDDGSLFELIDRHISQTNLPLEIIGIAVPGTVQSGIVRNIPAIPNWEDYNLEAALRLKYGCKVIVENDIKSATMGASNAYLNEEIHNIVFIYMNSKGLGAGIVINGKLYKGRNNFAGEIGYMVSPQGNLPIEELICAEIKRGEKQALIPLVAQVIVNLTCALEPDLFVIATKYLSRTDSGALHQAIAAHIAAQYVPQIVISGVENEVYLKGLVHICNQMLNKTIQITE